ncbi:MAG TPA: hypothetical protein VF198_00440 [Vicinamibacterales bacterium]
MRHLLPCSALAIVMMMAAAPDAGAQPLRVFVDAVVSPLPARPTEAEREQASAAYKAADTARKELEKRLRAQYGRKRDQWPAEAQEQLAAAEEARYRANAEWLYRTDAEPVTEHWRRDIAVAMTQSGNTGRKEHITSVESRDQADLIVTLVGVRNPGAVIKAAYDRCLAVRLARGPKLSAERFARVPGTWRPSRAKAARLAGPDAESPFWQFDCCGLYPHFNPDEAVANVINDFVGENRDVLLTTATSQ